jgi:putative transcriptional regulator
MAEGSLRGKLLVANPRTRDPNFDRTVVFMLSHGSHGALGVVLNRPSPLRVAEPLPKWEPLAAPPAVVFVGGPVSPESAICLARAALPRRRSGDRAVGWSPVGPEIGTLDLDLEPEGIGLPLDSLRVFAGYGGWGAGQVENEINADGWWVLDALVDDVVTSDPATLWKRVLRRQGGDLALASAWSADPSLN